MPYSELDILAFGAHPDDIELAIGGTIIKHVDKGYQVGVVDLTRGELGSRGDADTRSEEAAAAAKVMGINLRDKLELPDGFVEVNRENKLKVIEEIRRFRPKVILMPCETDRHPDHGNCGKLVRESCFLSGLKKIETGSQPHKPSQIFQYFLAWEYQFSFIIDVSREFARRLEAIKCYASQFHRENDETESQTLLSRPDFLDWIVNRARYYGNRIGVEYGEPFLSPGVMKASDLTKLKVGPFTT
ncbi:bacillithiol biosynthesis deacetylase BshB1 [bacterium]|nr:bacillithiol biosynthesis deacetylase BshB1 [bacterium]